MREKKGERMEGKEDREERGPRREGGERRGKKRGMSILCCLPR